jgi:hypothetical protein
MNGPRFDRRMIRHGVIMLVLVVLAQREVIGDAMVDPCPHLQASV